MLSRKILVTGGAGFLGSCLAKRLLAQGHQIDIVDNLSTGHKSNLPSGANFYQFDCGIEKDWEQLPHFDYDLVFHLAAQSSGEISFENPTYDLNTNTTSTLLIMNLCLKNKVNKIVFASSMSVYGKVPDSPISEEHVARPLSFYGVGKLASENYLRIYSNQNPELSCLALRFFNIYGPGQNMENLKQGMVSIYLAQAIRNKGLVEVKGDLSRFRDFIYIDDAVSALERSFEWCLNNSGFKSVNIGSGVKTRVADVLSSIETLLSHQFPLSIKTLAGTPGDQFGIFADSQLAEEELGWKAETSFEQGMRAFVGSVLDNKDS